MAWFLACFQISHSFSFRSLQSWLRSHISQNPFGISSCIATGRRLSWPLAGNSKLPYCFAEQYNFCKRILVVSVQMTYHLVLFVGTTYKVYKSIERKIIKVDGMFAILRNHNKI